MSPRRGANGGVNFIAYIPASLERQIKDEARRRGITHSEIVREALKAWLAQQEKTTP